VATTFDGPLLNGRWRLGPKLGAGGQGHTFVARDEKSVGGEKQVAVKQVKLGDGGWKKFDLFERECTVLRQLSHPGIPRVLDQFEGDPGTYYLVMDKAPGATLKAIATRARFTEAELRDVMTRVLDILAYLHGRRPPVIHRDVKPANLLRDADGKISLVDFGGVRAALREEGGSTVVGTFGYMAPEQLHGEATPATDVFGLGATIVALASGTEPEKIPRNGLRMDLGRALPSMSPDLRELLEQMTDPDPAKRPRTAEEVQSLLRRRVMLDRRRPQAAPREIADDDGSLMGEDPNLPAPLRLVLRLGLFAVGTFGYLATSITSAVFVPFIFAIVYMFSKPERKPSIKAHERRAHEVLRNGREEFRQLTQRARRRRPRELPPHR
jgi:serine/threonine protein kinase